MMKSLTAYLHYISLCIGAVLWLITGNTHAQSAYNNLELFCCNIAAFSQLFPQEKVYLHLDNSGYFVGETLWYKAYVIRTDTGRYTDISSVLYVELVDPFGEIVETQKLKIEHGQCHGDFSFNTAHTDGFYEIRAYTRYNTNWDEAGIYSRVFPVFKKPAMEGDYSKMEVRRDFLKYRRGDDIPDSLSLRELRQWKTTAPTPTVTFYPEGGALVQGLKSKVAFEIAYPDSIEISPVGTLQTAEGRILDTIQPLHYGRGVFEVLGTAAPLYYCFRHNGNDYRYALPTAQREGCTISVNTSVDETSKMRDVDNRDEVEVTINATANLQGKSIGLTLMHNGKILSFDTHDIDTAPWHVSYDRQKLLGGIYSLTLFDTTGQIYGQRQFFIYPHLASPTGRTAIDSVCVTVDKNIAPYRAMNIQLVGPPSQTVSIAVTDATTTTNACRENVCTYLLLSSELKGYVRDADYYLESDDASHRQAADLLCLVQGWTRYDWKIMAGLKTFEKRQPIEDALYLDGRLYPRIGNFRGNFWMSPRARKRTREVDNVTLSAVLYNSSGQVLRGTTVTDSAGYFAFCLPDISDDWTVQLHTTKNNKEKTQVIAINRNFQPACKTYNYYETQLQVVPTLQSPFCPATDSDYAAALKRVKDIEQQGWHGNTINQLGEVVVSAGRGGHWSIQNKRAIEQSNIHYDMVKEADKFADIGEGTPLLFDWLMSKKLFHDEFFVKNRGIGWYRGGSFTTFSLRDKPSKRYNLSNYNMGSTETPIRLSGTVEVTYDWYENLQDINGAMAGTLVERKEGCPNLYLDDIKRLYVSLEHGVTDFMEPYERSFLSQFDPFHVYIKTLPPHADSKSIRHTYMQGYNVAHTFQMNNYATMSEEADYRRTLYWAPDITFGPDGKANLVVYNNTTSRRWRIAVEGIGTNGAAIIGGVR